MVNITLIITTKEQKWDWYVLYAAKYLYILVYDNKDSNDQTEEIILYFVSQWVRFASAEGCGFTHCYGGLDKLLLVDWMSFITSYPKKLTTYYNQNVHKKCEGVF